MLRNLKNVILANVKAKYHKVILDKLKNQGTVVSSRQFPFRFFSAYEVLSGLLSSEGQSDQPSRAGRQARKKKAEDSYTPPASLIKQYQQVLV